VTPHVFRHTTAVHLLESGVELNVIRGWLGHVGVETTCRYAEINTRRGVFLLARTKAQAVKRGVSTPPPPAPTSTRGGTTTPPAGGCGASRARPARCRAIPRSRPSADP